MNNQPDNTLIDSTRNISVRDWLGYGAEFIAIFFASLVLSGRVYVQSYWNVFGLSPESIDSHFIEYAIVSPNVAVISVFITATTMLIIAEFRHETPDYIGDRNPRITYFIGFSIIWIGITIIGIIPKLNLADWTPGLAGLVFGLGFLGFIWGIMLWVQGGLKLEKKEPSKWEVALIRWIRNVPRVLLLAVIIIGFIATAIWALVDTADKFGANEAKFMLVTKPEATIQLDSAKGFEDLVVVSDNGELFIQKVCIITESDDFLYFCYGFIKEPFQLLVRAVPSSRVQSISYAVGVTHLGE